MEHKAFLDIVDCAAEDIESARHYMDVRGIEEHLIVAEYLQNYKAGKVSYREVATALRYDSALIRSDTDCRKGKVLICMNIEIHI